MIKVSIVDDNNKTMNGNDMDNENDDSQKSKYNLH